MDTKETHNREGVAVNCTVCGMLKAPRGRSVPFVMANSICDWECEGYQQEPLPGDLWPGETCGDFGYAHSHNATREIAADRSRR